MARPRRTGAKVRGVCDVRRSALHGLDVSNANRTFQLRVEGSVHVQEAHGDTAPSLPSGSGGWACKVGYQEMPVQS